MRPSRAQFGTIEETGFFSMAGYDFEFEDHALAFTDMYSADCEAPEMVFFDEGEEEVGRAGLEDLSIVRTSDMPDTVTLLARVLCLSRFPFETQIKKNGSGVAAAQRQCRQRPCALASLRCLCSPRSLPKFPAA